MITRWSITVLAVLVLSAYQGGIPVNAQTHDANGSDYLSRPAKTVLPADGVEIAMDSSGGMPIVKVKVNGQGPFRFAVSTGYAATLVTESLANRLQLPIIGQATNDPSSGRPVRTTGLVYIEKIELGEATLGNVKSVVRDLALIFPDDNPFDGVLSLSAFNKCLLTLDYPHERVLLKKGALPAVDGKEIMTFEVQRLLPTLKLSIGDVPVPIGIDSLASTASTLAHSFETKLPLKATPIVTGQSRSADATVELRMGRLKAMLPIGRHQIREPIVRFSGKGSVLAYETLRHFAITFDQASNRVRFAGASAEPITFPPLYSAGFGADLRDGTRKVWYVLQHLPAQKVGLRVGDVIKTVNGRAASDYPPAAWRALLGGAGKLTMKIERDGKPLDITLKTAEFFR